ncbi:allantoicase [Streptomyces luteolus]|uniref:Probable allantoicase n=1 Tax=Streptomyces luteolus TaxID=3043615 RepID=A0ABT6T479_9ACTN|nr:allantoicase [Streptomyces sp. B-S-A12]MDI3422677.1 allantoicase [Streptomyces sp. B-S-A12]
MTIDPSRANDAAPYGGGNPYADYRAGDFAFTQLTDLADRRFGAAVVAANDEFFAERENLLTPERAEFDPHAFAHKGKVMDGWETRRRRGGSAQTPHPDADDHDWALVRLGAPGIIRGIIVDTAHFRANYPQQISVQGACVEGIVSPERLLSDEVKWEEIIPRTEVRGHAANGFEVSVERRFTHLRLNQHPDGGVARLRVHGEVVPDPYWLELLGTIDLACVLNGGTVQDASDGFYSSPGNTILPDLSRKMDDGWETRRRRDQGNDWIAYRLAAQGEIRAVEIDTAYLKGNAAGWIALSACDGEDGQWTEIVPRTQLEPDTLHRIPLAAPALATHVRLDVFPDGGISRLHLHGSFTTQGITELRTRHDELTN